MTREKPPLTTHRPVVAGMRYFEADDGCDYVVVALDLDDAKRILGREGNDLLDRSEHAAEVEWSEVSAERAATYGVYLDEGVDGPHPLNTMSRGDWFTSEY